MIVKLFILVGISIAYGDDKAPALAEKVCQTQSIMATAWTMCIYDKRGPDEARRLIDKAMDEVRRIDKWMSEWKPNSLVSQINKNAGIRPVKVTKEALEVFQLAKTHSQLTGGVFDISFNVFFGMYNWKPGKIRFPSPKEIKNRLPLVDYKQIQIDPKAQTVFLKKRGMKIGFGGIGQGWAVDRAVVLLKKNKVSAGFVDGSGDTYFWGKKPDGKLWTVGIGDPRPAPGTKNSVLYKLYVTDVAVTTAGDTEHYFLRNGKRYHHIIDPRTGDSARSSAQVTAICKKAVLCDVADDGVFILGPKEGRRYAQRVGVEVVIVSPDKQVFLTKGLEKINTKWGPALQYRAQKR